MPRGMRPLLGLALALSVGCASAPGGEAERKGLHAVATTTMIADLVRQVGGHRVSVRGIMAPGGDPHQYKPVPDDAEAIGQADVVFVNGLKLEHWVDDLIGNAGGDKPVVVVSTGVKHRASPTDPAVPDPHFWFDVARWRQALKNVEAGLAAADPEGKDTFSRNAALYDAQLASLDAWVRDRLSAVPLPRRKLVTSHDAFAYFGEAYGVEVIPVQGISTDAEASTRELGRVVDRVRAAGVPAVFVETSVNPKLIEQVARETRTRVGGSLYSDSTGPLDSGGGSYVGMVRDNVGLIVEGLK